MATGSLPASSSTLEQERFIERQLNKTRRQVKVVELGVAGISLVVGVLVFFLIAALIDHWLLPLGQTGRFALLAVLVAGVTWYVWSVVVPLLRNSINPAYAALTIEQSAPTLKNSLINFLMLRSQRGQVHDVVYEAVEQRAASDLRSVPIDSVIDYSPLIKVGYALAAIFAITAAYKMLSPKDPLQTVARVAAPWADIARPSRVQIENVTPGDATQYFGDNVTVTAHLRGVRSTDRVAIIYSTADGQTVDHRIEMTPNDEHAIFTANLPGEGQGLQQDVLYRIEAGDAVSRDYALTVVSAPTIIVNKLAYDFPRYTQKPRETRERTGDIRALEGTRVTVHAQANHPIHAAYIELQTSTGQTQRVAMQAAETEATGTFVLELDGDRTTPKHTHYHISFMTKSGHPGKQPAVHSIDVIRDLPPEVEVLSPDRPQVEVPANGEAVIEVRAIDPDFALSRVGIKLNSNGRQLADKALVNTATGHNGQSVTKYAFRPSEFNLQAGDEVAWWATAADNRTAPLTSLPEPNTVRTKNFFFKIVAADPNANPQRDPNNSGNPQDQPQNGDMPPMPNQGEPQDQNQENPGEQNAGEQGDKKKQDMQESPKKEDQQNMDDMEGGQGEQGGNSSKSQGGKSDMPTEGENSSNSESGAGKSGEGTGNSEQPMPQEGTDNKQDMTGGANGGKSQGAGSKSEQPQEGGNEGASGKNMNEGADGSDSQGNEPGNGDQSGNSQNQSGGKSGQPNSQGGKQPDAEPREKAHEGEAFEEVLKRMIEKAEREEKQGAKGQPKEGQPKQGDNQNNGDGPTQDDFNKLSDETKQKLKDLLKKHQEQNGGGEKSDQPKSGVEGDSPQDSAQAGNQNNPAPQPGGANEQGNGEAPQPMNGAANSEKKQGSGANNERGQGETGQPNEAANTRPEKKSNTNEPASDEKRQGGMGTNGDSGAGQASDNKQGAAQAQEANRDKPKSQQSGEQAPSQENENEAQSPSGSKRQSDSQGGESGDRSGGGKQGPGQKANAAGNDAAGSNSAADEGAGAAQQSGEGETGSNGGDKKKAEGQTGKTGTEQGEGSSTKKGPQGDRAAQNNEGGEPGESSEQPMPGGQDDSEGAGKTGDFVTGGGKPSENTGRSQFADAAGPAAEKAKLDYAKNATDLVLEYLKDQKDNPDQQLLDDLGWTKDDLKAFLDRWAEAKREAAADPKAQSELNEALRSLGLRPVGDKLRRAETKSDNNRGLGDVGPTSGPPSKYLDQFRAFKKGAARQ